MSWFRFLCVPLVLGSMLSACTRGSAPALDRTAEPEMAQEKTATSTGSAGAQAQSQATAPEPMVVRKGAIELRHNDPSTVTREIAARVESARGLVVDSDTQTSHGVVTSSMLRLRVPEPLFHETLAFIRQTGELFSENVTGEDVTKAYADLGARLKSKKALEERLLELTSKTGSLADLLAVETELQRVRAEIEGLTVEQVALRHQASFSLIEVVVRAPDQPMAIGTESLRSRLANAVRLAKQRFFDVTVALVVLTGILLPLALACTPIVGIVLFRRRQKRALLRVPA